ncbi:MAG TPA: PAS domain S-box protein [Candidatus Sulfotelmatobacter sp.]|nr:PAS domain S-box protein [Candidatus Sulfotelmatobacter sp.]
MSQTRILLVDDDARVRRVISTMLSRHSGWEICGEADNGQQSVELARATKPDLILMDVSMPGMNGLDATRILRRESPRIPVILVSQNDSKIISHQAAEVGARAYCSKSDLARNLVPIIERALEARHSERTDIGSHIFERNPSDQASSLLAAIVDSSDDVIVSKNLDGIITSWNATAQRVFGYSPKEAIGSHITLIIPKDRLAEEDGIMSRVRRGERIDHFDTVRQRKDGTLVDISLTISPVKDSYGRVVGASKVAREITDRRRAERNTALLAAIVDSSDDAIVSKTLDGIITSWNKSAERIFGYLPEEAIGKHITLIIPRDRWDEESSIIARICRGERLDHFQTLRRRKDGSLVDVSLTISPVKDSAGTIIGASKVARDISAQVRAAEALRASEEELRHLSQSLDTQVRARTRELQELSWQLMRTRDEERRHVARELHDSAGQSLAVLAIEVDQLLQKASNSPELVADIERIRETLRQLHGEIRTTSYLLHPPLLDESGLQAAISWYAGGLTERTALPISVEISDDLGRLPRDLELVLFRFVQEALTNIHRHANATKAAIFLSTSQTHVTAEVRDNGSGMSAERLQQVTSGGSGVGIRGMRERVRQFQGSMQIHSDSTGTKVSVEIPLPTDQEPAQPQNLQAAV